MLFGSLEDENQNWDQFETNKIKFNVSTSYSEEQYTTELDYNKIPTIVKIKADRIVDVLIYIIKEILHSSNIDNLHLKEERGLINQTDGDEEEKYSSVIRNIK